MKDNSSLKINIKNKVIFLDIDGVLNNFDSVKTTDKINGCLGINDANLAQLKKLITVTKAEIILVSTWKLDYLQQNALGMYLKNKLEAAGLSIKDCTKDSSYNRGSGIADYLASHSEIENFVILDDDVFRDYDTFSLVDNLVKIQGFEGLTPEKVQEAIKILTKTQKAPDEK